MTGMDPKDPTIVRTNACSNCRRPVYLIDGVGWLHGELPQYLDHPMTCVNAVPADFQDYRYPASHPVNRPPNQARR